MCPAGRIDNLYHMIIAEVHTATELAFAGDNAHLGSAILLTNLDVPKGSPIAWRAASERISPR